MNHRLDPFKDVHKGLRLGLFQLTSQAGATDVANSGQMDRLKAKFDEVFHFLDHHALNEDRFLAPEMKAKGMAEADELAADHHALENETLALRTLFSQLRVAPEKFHAFYLALNRFLAHYLEHIDQEELLLLPAIHSRFTDAELSLFPQKSVAATEAKDKEMMLGYMFAAQSEGEVAAYLKGLRSKAPPEVIAFMEGIAKKSRRPSPND